MYDLQYFLGFADHWQFSHEIDHARGAVVIEGLVTCTAGAVTPSASWACADLEALFSGISSPAQRLDLLVAYLSNLTR